MWNACMADHNSGCHFEKIVDMIGGIGLHQLRLILWQLQKLSLWIIIGCLSSVQLQLQMLVVIIQCLVQRFLFHYFLLNTDQIYHITPDQHKATSISSCTTYHVMMPHSPTPLHHVIISLPWFNFSNKTMYLDLRWPKYAFCPSASSTYFGSALARCYISSTTVGGYQVTTWL